MKIVKPIIIILSVIALLSGTSEAYDENKAHIYAPFRYLTGGVTYALDKLECEDVTGANEDAPIKDGDVAIVVSSGVTYIYHYNATGTDSENSPSIIVPDDRATDCSGQGQWELADISSSSIPDLSATYETTTSNNFDSDRLNGDTVDDNAIDDGVIVSTIARDSELPTASSLSVDDLITLSGISEGATHLGTFTGSTITDNQTIKASLQLIETAVETKEGALSDEASLYATLSDVTQFYEPGENIAANLQINKADPSLILDATTATDTDFWIGVTEDADSVDDDLFQIGDGTTPGTNPFVTVNTSGNVGIGTTSPERGIDVISDNNYAQLRMSDGTIDNISKDLFITGIPYDVDQKDVLLGFLRTDNTSNVLQFGGQNTHDTGGINAEGVQGVTSIDFFAQAAVNTETTLSATSPNVKIENTAATFYGLEGANTYLRLYADDGDDNSDKAQIVKANGGNVSFQSYDSGAWVSSINIDTSEIVYMPSVAVHDIAADDNERLMWIDPDDGEIGYVSTSLGSLLSVDDLVTLSGVADGATHLGTFTGSTITDNVTNKAALQALETAVETKEGALTDEASLYATLSDVTQFYEPGENLAANLQINKADPSLILDTTTATDTDYWIGVTEDADGVDDDLFQIGDGTTPGTNPFVTVNTSGNVGIGTTNPERRIDVISENNYAQLRMSDGASDNTAKDVFITGIPYDVDQKDVLLGFLRADSTSNVLQFGGQNTHNTGSINAEGVQGVTSIDFFAQAAINTETTSSATSPNVKIENTAATFYGLEGANTYLRLCADDGDDNSDKAQIVKANGGNISFQSYDSGAWVSSINIDTSEIVYMPSVAVHDIAADDNETAMFIDPDDGEIGYSSSTSESKENETVLYHDDTKWIYDLIPKSFNRRIANADGTYSDTISDRKEQGFIAEDVVLVAPRDTWFEIPVKEEVTTIEEYKAEEPEIDVNNNPVLDEQGDPKLITVTKTREGKVLQNKVDEAGNIVRKIGGVNEIKMIPAIVAELKRHELLIQQLIIENTDLKKRIEDLEGESK